jgi:hypothetical protein
VPLREFLDFGEYERLYGSEAAVAMTRFTPMFALGGSAHLKALLRPNHHERDAITRSSRRGRIRLVDTS